MAAEVELKLTIAAALLPKVRKHPALAAVVHGRARTSNDVSTYYDTRSGELRKAGVALRVRRSGRRWLQTVKGAGDTIGALHRRAEYEWAMPDPRIDARKLSTTPWRGIFEVTAGRLRPVFVTDVRRTAQPLEFADGTRATLCLDAGEIRAGRKRAPVTEIEIELVQGEPGQLHELALSLAADLPVAMAQASKAERGYALASPTPRTPLRARKLALDADVSVGIALALWRHCLAQIGANAQSIAAGADANSCTRRVWRAPAALTAARRRGPDRCRKGRADRARVAMVRDRARRRARPGCVRDANPRGSQPRDQGSAVTARHRHRARSHNADVARACRRGRRCRRVATAAAFAALRERLAGGAGLARRGSCRAHAGTIAGQRHARSACTQAEQARQASAAGLADGAAPGSHRGQEASLRC